MNNRALCFMEKIIRKWILRAAVTQVCTSDYTHENNQLSFPILARKRHLDIFIMSNQSFA